MNSVLCYWENNSSIEFWKKWAVASCMTASLEATENLSIPYSKGLIGSVTDALVTMGYLKKLFCGSTEVFLKWYGIKAKGKGSYAAFRSCHPLVQPWLPWHNQAVPCLGFLKSVWGVESTGLICKKSNDSQQTVLISCFWNSMVLCYE